MRRRSYFDLVDDYLAMRRNLGFDVDRHRWLLRDFARFTNRNRYHGPITVDLALQWAMSSCPGEPLRAERRLSAVRQFARHLTSLDPATEIPPVGLLGHATGRNQPHIYSDAEISALLKECSRLQPRQGLRPCTYVAFFSLLASTGLRLSEACHLHRSDVDLREGLLTVDEGKFRKSRLVPLHPTAIEALTRYAAQRDAFRAARRSQFFFSTDRASALTRHAVETTFSGVRDRLDWTTHGRTGRPRIHDLRHTFAVRRLLRWYQEGADVNRKILALATYLGHAKVTDTYWYLSAVPELMAVTARRFEHFAQPQRGGVS
jgi:integrase